MNSQKFIFPIISIIIGSFLSIIFLEVVLKFFPVRDATMMLPVNSKNKIIRFKGDRNIIWSHGSKFSIITKKRINNYGFLNDQDYNSDETSPLLAIIGDSYVEAAQVENRYSMHGILSRNVSDRGRVYSFGSSGSQLPTYLAYANYVLDEFNVSKHSFVFIIVGNDFDESLIEYKKSPGFHYFSNEFNRFNLIRIDYQPKLSKLLLRKSDLIRYLFLNVQLKNWKSIQNIFNTDVNKTKLNYVGNTLSDFDSKRIESSKKVVDVFFQHLSKKKGLGNDNVLFVLDGMRPHLYDSISLERAKGSYFSFMRNYFINSALSGKYEIIDMQPIFIKTHKLNNATFEFPSDGHWNNKGHSLVADEIIESSVYKKLFY